jgi:hypothetical protein
MRDDQNFDHEHGAATSPDYSDDHQSSEQVHGLRNVTGRLGGWIGDLRSRPGSSLGELWASAKSGAPDGRLRSLPQLRKLLDGRTPRLTVAVGVISCLGLVSFLETTAVTVQHVAVAGQEELAQRAEADRTSRSHRQVPDDPATALPDQQQATLVIPDDPDITPTPTEPALPPGHKESGPVAGLSEVQMNNAKAIVWTGVDMGMPRRALIIAVATAMQESTLLNRASEVVPESKRYPHQGTGWDHDSVGLFQQRASAGWGPVHKLMDPAYASQQFYRALMRVPGWQHMRLTEAAQAVQVSAFPEHYAKHEARATIVVDALADVD